MEKMKNAYKSWLENLTERELMQDLDTDERTPVQESQRNTQ